VGLKDLSDPIAVANAVTEFEELGREQFLAKYGFGRAFRYYLEVDGARYDAKAIIGAAHGYEHPELGPLTSKDFASSESAVKGKLESLGFKVVTGDESSDDEDDEAISGYAPPVSNPAAFVAWARQRLSSPRIKVRADAEAKARRLLDHGVGRMNEEQLRDLCRAFNEDMSKKKVVHARFRPAFMGATLNTLVANLEAVNRQSARLWQENEAEALLAMTETLTNPKSLPGGGRSFPSMLMYLRDPEKFAVWTKSTHNGLRVLTDFDGASRKGGAEAFLAFCDAVKNFRAEYSLAPQEVDLVLARATRVANAGSFEFDLNEAKVAEAKSLLQDIAFEKKEIGYKRGVSQVLRRCFEPDALEADGLTELLPALIRGHLELDAILDPSSAEEVQAIFSSAGFPSAGRALFNLSGGQFGFAQYVWLPKAIEYGLLDEVRSAFKGLLDESQPLAKRIDQFRDALYEIQKQLEERGGFESNWTVMKISLSFIGSILGAVNPDRYTYYTATKMRAALEDLGATWPRGTNGQRYEQVCGLMQDLQFALQERGVEVADLIDVQSLLFKWGSAIETGGEGGPGDQEEQIRSLARRIYWNESRTRTLLETAHTNKQLLFYGPPGTGKTWIAKALADTLAGEGEGKVELVQFHPSYAYEDFIEGIRPRLSSDDAQLSYELRRGVFLRLVDRAREFPEEEFFLIVDEINRANLPRVFGELLYGLEYRGAENAISLPYSDTETFIPENLWIIGTMNTADRSVALVDAAVRRRFRHVHLTPDVEVLRAWLEDKGMDDRIDPSVKALTALNTEIESLLGTDVLIGHSYLMRSRLSGEVLDEIWEQDIAPVLHEHLFNRPEEVDRLRSIFLT
jgi:MoxR-like ATPase